MSTKIPYVIQPGSIKKILSKIKEAKTPERFTQDFLETKLKCSGGNYRQFIPFAKKIGLLNTDGTPTDRYKKYRNPATSGAAIAESVKIGYKEIFERNEYAHDLNKEQFKGLVVEITGLEPNNRVVQLICQTFEILKSIANFESKLPTDGAENEGDGADAGASGTGSGSGAGSAGSGSGAGGGNSGGGSGEGGKNIGLNLSYIINLVLPKTDDPAVFNAIFKSLKENLIGK